MSERDPGVVTRFQGYRLVLNLIGFRAVRDCLPTRWHPLLDDIVMGASAEQLILDPRLNEIGNLGAGRTGIVVDRQVLRHLLPAGLAVHTDATLTGYDVLADGNVQAQFARRGPATADLLVGADGVTSAVRRVLSPQTAPIDTGVRFVIGRTPLTDEFASLSKAYGSKIAGDGVSLLRGAMRFRTPPQQAAEQPAPEVTLPDIGGYARWAMILPPNGSLEDLTAQDAVRSSMRSWHPELRALIEQADPDNSTVLSVRVVKPGERAARAGRCCAPARSARSPSTGGSDRPLPAPRRSRWPPRETGSAGLISDYLSSDVGGASRRLNSRTLRRRSAPRPCSSRHRGTP
ncbi:FAD-dependent monooxygenase [Streptomyces sp. MUSC 14]|uniref:FAD-dependent monooxygenase n=1 Tax=Streptomyces sp. MUSC 14 TaxID=1354889 RepID=UPI00210BF753|nr:FAD-dependent monooxygenase [Streptomyces sp. MUSC 14]